MHTAKPAPYKRQTPDGNLSIACWNVLDTQGVAVKQVNVTCLMKVCAESYMVFPKFHMLIACSAALRQRWVNLLRYHTPLFYRAPPLH